MFLITTNLSNLTYLTCFHYSTMLEAQLDKDVDRKKRYWLKEIERKIDTIITWSYVRLLSSKNNVPIRQTSIPTNAFRFSDSATITFATFCIKFFAVWSTSTPPTCFTAIWSRQICSSTRRAISRFAISGWPELQIRTMITPASWRSTWQQGGTEPRKSCWIQRWDNK